MWYWVRVEDISFLHYTDRLQKHLQVCVYVQFGIHKYISLLFHLKGPRMNNTSGTISTHSTQILFLNFFFNQKNHGSLEKWLILGQGQRKYKMSLQLLAVPETKGGLKNKLMRVCQKSQLKELQNQDNWSIKIK